MELTRYRWWFVSNVCGIGLWLYVASRIWPRAPYEHCDFAPGDPWWFLLLVLPLLALAALVQIVALVVGAINCAKRKNASLLVAVAVVAIAWTVAAVYDFHRGQRYVTGECPIFNKATSNMRLSGRAVNKLPVVLRCRAAQL
jgi:hypothetical protein